MTKHFHDYVGRTNHKSILLVNIGNNYEEKLSYVHVPGVRPLEMITLGQALENATNNWPDRPFIISKHESISMTFSDIMNEVNKLSSGLLSFGFKPGDRLAICSPNSVRWLITTMAAARLGVVTVAINPANTAKELEYCLNKAEVRALAIPSSVKNQDFVTMLHRMIPELGKCRPGALKCSRLKKLDTVIIMDDNRVPGTFSFEDFKGMGDLSNLSNLNNLVDPESYYSILFTSGTTGLPKAAVQSHFSYTNNSRDLGYRCELDSRHQTICLQIPFFHAFGLLVLLGSLQHGSSLVLPSMTYNVKKTLEAVVQERCTILTGTPTMYIDLIKNKEESNVKDIASKIAITGGATCSSHLFTRMKKHLGIESLNSVYGMTEVLSAFQSMPGEDDIYALETVGKTMDHVEAKIVDKNGVIVPFGTPGELLVRSYANMSCYWGDEAKTAEILDKQGWLRTGDQFTLDENGYGKVYGRYKDIIIRGGENIFPREIEDYINTHPDVIETQVFGVSDDRMGEEICAGVRVKDGSSFDYDKMKAFCKGVIANYKIPRYVKIVQDFPKTTSGKIQKFKLKEMVESGKL